VRPKDCCRSFGLKSWTRSVRNPHDILLGITKASLSTDSFISAASFQKTTTHLIFRHTTTSHPPARPFLVAASLVRIYPLRTSGKAFA
jgi:hypothetical protein